MHQWVSQWTSERMREKCKSHRMMLMNMFYLPSLNGLERPHWVDKSCKCQNESITNKQTNKQWDKGDTIRPLWLKRNGEERKAYFVSLDHVEELGRHYIINTRVVRHTKNINRASWLTVFELLARGNDLEKRKSTETDTILGQAEYINRIYLETWMHAYQWSVTWSEQ